MTGDRSEVSGMVSTIIPVFNRADLLREAVASVLSQTYSPIEVIIVDDGSTDHTQETCLALQSAHPVVVRSIRQSNAGPGVARETGRRAAHGEFIQYLDSDDRLLPRKFELQTAALRERPECGVAYCYTLYHRIGEAPIKQPWKGSGNTVAAMFPSFLVDRWWDTPTPLYRRSVCDAAGPWSDLRLEEDWEYDCRIASLGTTLVHCREFLAEVRDHDGNRLCRGTYHDPRRNRERARAHQLIFQHAQRAGISDDAPELRHFSRSLFLLSRQCGASGLAKESRELFELAVVSARGPQLLTWDFRLYRAATLLFGWRTTGRFACWTDRWRPSASSRHRTNWPTPVSWTADEAHGTS
jgi:glycosyltransferase involved in cell wall biosynthesis